MLMPRKSPLEHLGFNCFQQSNRPKPKYIGYRISTKKKYNQFFSNLSCDLVSMSNILGTGTEYGRETNTESFSFVFSVYA